MPWKRSSLEKRRSKSSARAAKHRERLGIPERVPEQHEVVNPIAPLLPQGIQETVCNKKNPRQEAEEFLSSMHVLLAHKSPPPHLKTTVKVEPDEAGQDDSMLTAKSSVATTGTKVHVMKQLEPERMKPTRSKKRTIGDGPRQRFELGAVTNEMEQGDEKRIKIEEEI